MIKHRFSLGLLALVTLLAQAAPMPALAQGISQKVAVCNPDFTGRCIKPDTNGAVPVTGTFTPSGTQDTNIKQVNGAAVNVGVGAAGTGTQRVTTSTDSTIGTVTTVGAVTAITNALPAGSNVIGHVIADTGSTTAVTQATASNLNAQVVGNVASGAADSGNPIKHAGVFNTTQPTVTTGQRVDQQMTARGEALMTISNGAVSAPVQAVSDGMSGTPNALAVVSYTGLASSGGFEARMRDMSLAITSGVGTAAVHTAPTSAASAAIAPNASSAVASNLVAKAAAGNLYHWTVTAGASAGFVLIFDATSAPADGAVTPKECVGVAANTTVRDSLSDIPERFATGITLVFSTTGCFSKTASATAFIKADAL